MSDMLTASHLQYTIPHGKTILRDVSFNLEQGSFTLLLGANGEGKSMLLRILKGLLSGAKGSIVLDGKECIADKQTRLTSIALVFQDAATQIVAHTVEKDIRFGMDNLGLDKQTQDQRLEHITSLLHLDDKLQQDPRTLSGGEQRRLAIAGVLVMNPKLLIMDEPFAGLDWTSVKQVITTLLALKQQGVTILLVSHEAEKILAHVDHVLLLEKGTIVIDGTAEATLPSLRSHDIFLPKNCTVEELSWLHP